MSWAPGFFLSGGWGGGGGTGRGHSAHDVETTRMHVSVSHDLAYVLYIFNLLFSKVYWYNAFTMWTNYRVIDQCKNVGSAAVPHHSL